MTKVSHADNNYEVSLFFRQRWKDERLGSLFPGNETLLLDESVTDRIWTPDLIFKNEETALRHHALADQRMLEISPAGSVMVSEHLTMKFRCIFHLKLFPFDTQTCPVTIHSFGFRKDKISVKWSHRHQG